MGQTLDVKEDIIWKRPVFSIITVIISDVTIILRLRNSLPTPQVQKVCESATIFCIQQISRLY